MDWFVLSLSFALFFQSLPFFFNSPLPSTYFCFVLIRIAITLFSVLVRPFLVVFIWFFRFIWSRPVAISGGPTQWSGLPTPDGALLNFFLLKPKPIWPPTTPLPTAVLRGPPCTCRHPGLHESYLYHALLARMYTQTCCFRNQGTFVLFAYIRVTTPRSPTLWHSVITSDHLSADHVRPSISSSESSGWMLGGLASPSHTLDKTFSLLRKNSHPKYQLQTLAWTLTTMHYSYLTDARFNWYMEHDRRDVKLLSRRLNLFDRTLTKRIWKKRKRKQNNKHPHLLPTSLSPHLFAPPLSVFFCDLMVTINSQLSL